MGGGRVGGTAVADPGDWPVMRREDIEAGGEEEEGSEEGLSPWRREKEGWASLCAEGSRELLCCPGIPSREGGKAGGRADEDGDRKDKVEEGEGSS